MSTCLRRSTGIGVAAFAVCVAAALPVRAYEGAGMMREEEAAPPPKPPQLTKAPAVEQFVEAAYPPDLFAEEIGGEVVLVITIDADGRVSDATVSRSSGFEEFDLAAIDALKQFRFSPAEFDGVPGPVRLEYLYRFEPVAPEPPPAEVVDDAPRPVNLKGRVLERGTRDPLEGATVYLPEADLVAETDARGHFEIRGAPIGTVKIEISATTHRRFVTTEEIRAGESTELTAYLWPLIEGGFQATVRGEREKKEVARRTLTQEELKSVPGTFGDPLRVLQNMPGVARGSFVSGALLVRGAQPQDTGVYVDGVPIPLLYHFGGGPSVLNPSFIDKIDFYPGAYGAKYGRAIAGIVDVTTKPPAPKRLHGNIDVDLLDAGLYLEGPVWEGRPELGTWAVAARRSYYDAFLPLILDAARQPGQGQVTVQPYYWDYQARYDVNVAGNRLELSAFGSQDILGARVAGDADVQPFEFGSKEEFHRFRFKWSRHFGDGLSAYFAPTYGITSQTFNLADQVSVDATSNDLTVRAAVVKEFSPQLKFEAGLDTNTNWYALDFLIPELPDFPSYPGGTPDLGPSRRDQWTAWLSSTALYADAVWNPWGGLRIIPGMRLEAYSTPRHTQWSPEPRIAARYEFGQGTTAKAAWGIFRQGAQPFELTRNFGNPLLGLLRSEQTVVGVEHQFTPKLLLDVQAFYNWRSELVAGTSARHVIDGKEVPARYDNSGRGQAYGLEFLLKHDVTERFYGWVAYTLSRSERRDAGRSEDAGHPVYRPMSYDQTHNLIVVGSYKLDGGWEIGTRFRLTSGRPTTPVIDSYFYGPTGGYRRVNGEIDSERTATFHQLDFRVEKLWTFETWRMSAFLDIQNVYNAANQEGVLYNYNFTQSAPLQGLPFLPVFGVTGAF